MRLYPCTLVLARKYNRTHAYPCAVISLCLCACTTAHTYAVIVSCSRVLVRLCKHDCTVLFGCALVPAQLHTMMQLCFRALVLVCSRACTHAYIRAVVRLCKGSRIDKAQKRTLPSCLYDGYAQQNLTHLLSLSHLLRASRSRDTSSSWLMPKFVQMQSMSSPPSRCQVATCSTTRSKSSLSTWNSSGIASPCPSVRKSTLHSNTMLKRRRK